MRRWALGMVLLSVALTAAAGEVTVRLTDVPGQIRLPLSEGENALLTAQVDGEVRSVWVATGRDARARYLLARVGKGVYQVNLADPVLSAMLEASGPGQVRVFAESPDAAVSASIPVSYSVRPRAGKWHLPPRVFVHAEGKATEVTRWPQGLEPEMLALMAEVRGQGMAITLPGLSGLPFGSHARELAAWFEPSEVERIEVRFDPDADRTGSRASAGKHEWEFAPADLGAATCELPVTAAIREAWKQAGQLAIACSQEGMDDLRVVLKAPPGELDLPEDEARFTIVQRYTEAVPGSDGYLLVHIDDITAGQTLLTLKTADGRELVERKSVRQGDSVPFVLGKNEYTLTVGKLVNLLLGDDYAELVVAPLAGEGAEVEGGPARGRPAAESPATKP